MKFAHILIILALFLTAGFARAQVDINEVAWMGSVPESGETANSAANREWIELKNIGLDSVDLSGWILEAADGSPSINLSGSIMPNAFFLLERSNDDSVPGIRADQIYVGALSNAGEVLILKDAGGDEIDRVDGSDGWSIGGDNSTKETMQKVSSGWITAQATPKAENAGGSTPTKEEAMPEDTAQTSESADAGNWEENIPTKFAVFAGADKTILAGAVASFEAAAKYPDGTEESDAQFFWSFGDGSTASGKKVAHTFSFPGTYVAHLSANFDDYSASDFLTAKVIANPLEISDVKTDQYIEIFNNSSAKLEISGFGLRLGARQFYFPAGTFISARAKIPVAQEVLGFTIQASGTVDLLYSTGKVLLSRDYPSADPAYLASEASIAQKPAPAITSKAADAKPLVGKPTEPKAEKLTASVSDTLNPDSLNAKRSFWGEYFWLIAGLLAGALAGAALIIAKKYLIT